MSDLVMSSTSMSKTSGANSAKETVATFLRRFVASATDWLNKYHEDIFFRTQIRVIALQFAFTICILGFFAIAVHLIGNRVSQALATHVHTVLGDSAPEDFSST